MANQEPTFVFDQERASNYNKRFAKLAPLRDALHLGVAQNTDEVIKLPL